MKKLLKYSWLLLIPAAIAGYFGYKMYNKPHTDIVSVKADFTLTAAALFSEYEADENAANAKYLGKIIEVNGNVLSAEADDRGIVNLTIDGGGMMGGISCKMDSTQYEAALKLNPGTPVNVKGELTGKLMDVELNRCFLIAQ
jgi:hypothetical protein